MWKYNKGEWSEIYTFAYLLNSGVLYSADKDLNKIEDVYFPIIKIIREETADTPIDYHTGDMIKIYKGDVLLSEVSKERFTSIVDTLLEEIPKGNRAFEIPIADEFFQSIYCNKIKANSNKKEDITIQLQDIHTGISPICGFSIKSYLGARPTLINPGRNTNFVFTISNCDDTIMNTANAIATRTKIKDKISYLLDSGCELVPVSNSISSQFVENLQFIDTLMPNLLQLLVLYSYRYDLHSIGDIVEKIKANNPLAYSNAELYTYKIKKLLCACALGLTPERSDWHGAEDANGGYITVKSDGSIVCYHLYNRTEFENYLFDYTAIERPSTPKYDYMTLYTEAGEYRIKLCLQIRFIDNKKE